MKRRVFAKQATLLSAAAAAGVPLACNRKMSKKNWAGNFTYHNRKTITPADVASLARTLQKEQVYKPIGTRHSFNQIANTNATHISLGHWQHQPQLNKTAGTVTVDANMRYGELGIWLEERGLAIHNLASLPHISIAGACATATHGSGDANGNLATAISSVQMMTPQGNVVQRSDEDPASDFYGVVAGLGAVGIMTKMTLKVEPSYQIRQDLFVDLPLEQLREHFDDITSAGYSVSMFTDYQRDVVNQIWVKSKIGQSTIDPKTELYGAKPADRKLHPIIEIDPIHCTEQEGQPGPWHQRLPHFKLEFTPSSGEELQSEYFVPRDKAVEAIMALYSLREQIAPQILISEIRTIAADRLWMSPCFEQDSVALHFTWKQNIKEVTKLLSVVEETLKPFEVKPHWGKLFNFSPDYLEKTYPKIHDFRALAEKYDPGHQLRNSFLEKNIFNLT